MLAYSLLIRGLWVRVPRGSYGIHSLLPNGNVTMLALNRNQQPPTLVSWAFAPEWLTTDEAAYLMGYNTDEIQRLIDTQCVDAEESFGRWMIEKKSLRELQEVLFGD